MSRRPHLEPPSSTLCEEVSAVAPRHKLVSKGREIKLIVVESNCRASYACGSKGRGSRVHGMRQRAGVAAAIEWLAAKHGPTHLLQPGRRSSTLRETTKGERMPWP